MDFILLPDAPVRGIELIDLDSNGYPDPIILYQKRRAFFILNFLGKRLIPYENKMIPIENTYVGPAVVGNINGAGTHNLLFFPNNNSPFLLQANHKPRYLHFFLRGNRENRNAIGARIQIKTNRNSFLREIGIRSTIPDQSALTLPIPLDNTDKINTVEILWSDKQKREIPYPKENQMLIIQPN